MICIENQCFAFLAESPHIHTGHGIHLHHILHSSALFGKGNHGRNLLIFQLFNLYFNGFLLQRFLHQFSDCLALRLQLFLCFPGCFGL